jgi:hypothetical protein
MVLFPECPMELVGVAVHVAEFPNRGSVLSRFTPMVGRCGCCGERASERG